jgi:hypothetical protein
MKQLAVTSPQREPKHSRFALRQPSTCPASSTDTVPYFAEARAQGRFGVVLAGIAQEKDSTWGDGGPDSHPHFEFARQSVFPNFSYFYPHDTQLGPAFVKITISVPFSMWVGCNGHEWAKRRAVQEGFDPGLRPEVSARAPVARAWRDLDHALNDLIAASGVAA